MHALYCSVGRPLAAFYANSRLWPYGFGYTYMRPQSRMAKVYCWYKMRPLASSLNSRSVESSAISSTTVRSAWARPRTFITKADSSV